MAPLIVINVVGLTPRLLAHMPNVAKAGSAAALRPVLPAVTCSMQATLLTGSMPRDHGIVGNGWYFRDLGEVLLWRQHNALIQGDQLWTAAPGLRTANVCWWYAMGAPTDLLVTPRPVYRADGRKSPDCYTRPPSLHDDLEAALGPFPLFTYWGPNAGIASSEWIIAAARRILARERPDLLLVYVPHLDYDLQRYGPAGPEAIAAARTVDAALAGVDEVLDQAGKAKYGLDHERAGELVAVAEPDAWFTYYYWLSDDRAPDFARLVDIHRKPGYDPAELFMDSSDPFVKLRAAAALARKKLGFRYTMRVVPLDPAPVRGSHGRLPDLPDDGPLIIGPFYRDSYQATEVKGLLASLARRSR